MRGFQAVSRLPLAPRWITPRRTLLPMKKGPPLRYQPPLPSEAAAVTAPSIGRRTGGTWPAAATCTQLPVSGPTSVKSPPAKMPRAVAVSASTSPSVTQTRSGSTLRVAGEAACPGVPIASSPTATTIVDASRLSTGLRLSRSVRLRHLLDKRAPFPVRRRRDRKRDGGVDGGDGIAFAHPGLPVEVASHDPLRSTGGERLRRQCRIRAAEAVGERAVVRNEEPAHGARFFVALKDGIRGARAHAQRRSGPSSRSPGPPRAGH